MYSCNGCTPYLDAWPPIIYQSYEWIMIYEQCHGMRPHKNNDTREILAVELIGTNKWITI